MQNKANSPLFPTFAQDYLVLNDWNIVDRSKTVGLFFEKGDRMITVKGDTIQFLVYNDEEEGQRVAEYSVYHSFTGVSELDEFKFMLLCHITDAVPLKSFVKKANPNETLFNIMADHLRMQGNREELPVNY